MKQRKRKCLLTAIIFMFCMFLIRAEAGAKRTEITISAAEDCTLASDIKQPRSVNFFSKYKSRKQGYFFSKVKHIFKKDDLSIVNLEGTLSTRGARANKKWAFRGLPSYTEILKKGGIDAVGFANNHVKDYGEVSYQDTKAVLKRSGILYSSSENVALYFSKGKRIVMVSVSSVDVLYNPVDKLRELLKKAKKKKPDLLIVNMHSGTEYTNSATAMQKTLAHIAVDEGGADLVLGHHPHVIQGIERRKGAYIVYSLGNFCFGGNTNPRDKDSMIFQQTFVFENGKLKWKKSKASLIPCRLSSHDSINDYQPTEAKGNKRNRILRRMNQMSRPYGVYIAQDGKLLDGVAGG